MIVLRNYNFTVLVLRSHHSILIYSEVITSLWFTPKLSLHCDLLRSHHFAMIVLRNHNFTVFVLRIHHFIVVALWSHHFTVLVLRSHHFILTYSEVITSFWLTPKSSLHCDYTSKLSLHCDCTPKSSLHCDCTPKSSLHCDLLRSRDFTAILLRIYHFIVILLRSHHFTVIVLRSHHFICLYSSHHFIVTVVRSHHITFATPAVLLITSSVSLLSLCNVCVCLYGTEVTVVSTVHPPDDTWMNTERWWNYNWEVKKGCTRR
jgi:hypothetical protein